MIIDVIIGVLLVGGGYCFGRAHAAYRIQQRLEQLADPEYQGNRNLWDAL